MRFSQVFNRTWVPRLQNDQSYPVPFQDLYPLKLKDRHEAQGRSDSVRPCVPQLTVLLQCFKDTDFNQKRCTESLAAYYACIDAYNAKQSTGVKQRKLSDVKRVRDLTKLEATRLLKQKPLNAK